MLIKNRMNREVVTIPPSTTILEAQKIMKDKNIRRLPVVEKGKLVGIVTYNDLLEASPSKATALSRFEITYLLSKMSVAEIMTKKVVYVQPDTPIEEAALIMNKNQIGGLPVMEGDQLVGIITESDIFEILIETLGVREGGARLTLELPQKPGVLHKVTGVIRKYEINILSLATFYQEHKPDYRYVVMRLATREPEKIIEELKQDPDVTVYHVWITPEEE